MEEIDKVSTATADAASQLGPSRARRVSTIGSSFRKQEKKTFTTRIKELYKKYGPDLDVPTVLLMAKGGLPPVIAMAMYQADDVSEVYTTVGYLIAIISIFGFAVMPRAKFMQTMFLDIIATCLATCLNLLMCYCAVKARQHSGVDATSKYNSSASAVCGVFLFFQTYFVNMMRAKYQPTLQFPGIIYTVFVVVASTNAPRLVTMTASTSFIMRLLKTFMTGFGIATGVSLFILPITSRKIVLGTMNGYIGALRKSLQAHSDYFQSMEIKDMFYRVSTGLSGDKQRQPEAQTVKKSVAAIQALQGKLQQDLPFAKREVAYGYLGPDDLQTMSKMLRGVMLPLAGLSSVVDIFERLTELNGYQDPNYQNFEIGAREMDRRRLVEDWNDIMRTVHEPFQIVFKAMDDGLAHVQLQTKIKKFSREEKKAKKKAAGDVESKGNHVRPGEAGFSEYLEQQIQSFYEGRRIALSEWCLRKGIQVPQGMFDDPNKFDICGDKLKAGEVSQRSLFALLYMEYLLYSTAKQVLEFVRWADDRVAYGKLDHKRIIVPGHKRLRKWFRNLLKDEDAEHGADNMMGDVNGGTQVHLGDAFKKRKDPEHLPPENTVEKIGDKIRAIPNFLRSRESVFGLRVACATMTIGIVNFLSTTQTFFIRQRLLWAMMMVAISMSPTAGQSLFSFSLRIIGTFGAMCASFIVWYIVDGRIPGVIVFYWISAASYFYIILKKPRYVIIGLISVMTLTTIIGYELQVKKVGKIQAESNGQPYYPVYLLAPYRLATVCGGLAVAFIWTFFPYPISEHSELRSQLGSALYLLANYYSIVHETFRARVRGEEGDLTSKTSPGRKMQKQRLKVYSKQLLLLTNLRATSEFQKWELAIGGKFPRERYTLILNCVENITRYIALLAFASQTFSNPVTTSETAWAHDFRRLLSNVNLTAHEITSLLALLSAAIKNGQPLPPYLKPPQPYALSNRLEELDQDILSLKHVMEPGYAAFAVIQIATRCVTMDIEKLLREVKGLVGEMDFSFHVNSVASSRTSMAMLSRRTSFTGAATEAESEDESDEEDEEDEDGDSDATDREGDEIQVHKSSSGSGSGK
ncbi:uncharacterized protein J3D65DRAFT_639850 [Phyllosticta citribraziliensis]|uniref:ER transporter 6TM N-terminal domain-containing protein n=1 Tax=Phyllosticta citribraziliensis TaxID=989973 RepID=A0ABR1L6N1_9PEZI